MTVPPNRTYPDLLGPTRPYSALHSDLLGPTRTYSYLPQPQAIVSLTLFHEGRLFLGRQFKEHNKKNGRMPPGYKGQ